MYVAVVTGGNASNLHSAVAFMTAELKSTGASDTLHIWVSLGGTVAAAVAAVCQDTAAASGVRLDWKHVDSLLASRDPLAERVRAAIAAALPGATCVGATRLLMKREAAGDDLISVDDDIVGAVQRGNANSEEILQTGSNQVLVACAGDEAPLLPAEPGTLLRVLTPARVRRPSSVGAHVIQPGLIGDAGADAPVTELEYGLPLNEGGRARQVRRIPLRTCIGPLDRLMTYAWAASAEASNTFFPVAFRNAEGVWAAVERLRRPAVRLVHVPVGCIHEPGAFRDARGYSVDAAVLQWRTNDWLALLWAESAGESGEPFGLARELCATDDCAWQRLVERSRELRRRVLRYRIARFEAYAQATKPKPRRVTKLSASVVAEYQSEACWIPTEWRRWTRRGKDLREYVRATGHLAIACCGEIAR